jgi:hypothetical protein
MGRILLFITGFIQVSLIAAQTYQIAHGNMFSIFGIGFFISLVWSFNIKKVAFGNWWDRIVYATGAAVGSVSGVYLARLLNC